MSDDFLLLILTILLIDKRLQMNLYKVHNLPAFYRELKLQFTYVLVGQYLAISKYGMYAALPIAHYIPICITT